MKVLRESRKLCAILLMLATFLSGSAFAADTTGSVVQEGQEEDIQWKVLYDEQFQDKPEIPQEWIVDDYSIQDDEFYGEDGYAIEHMWNVVGGPAAVKQYRADLASFQSFRQSYTFGELIPGKEVGWLTVEAYGRGQLDEKAPEYGGQVIWLESGGAQLICTDHTDAVIIRSTEELPDTYKLEVTVRNMDVGGKNYDENFWEDPHWTQDAWTSDGKMNGYDEKTATSLNAGPWRPSGDVFDPENPYAPAYDQNGGYFLSIVDYPDPKPHNNLFLHHHRKVAMDTDNNVDFIDGWGGPWSKVWNGTKYVDDGSRYISMLWANGDHPNLSTKHDYLQYLQTGQKFYSFQPDTGEPRINTVEMVDKYIPGEEYTFTIIRTPEYYEMSVEGNFFYGGHTTYSHRKDHLPTPENNYTYTWHFNQNTDELDRDGKCYNPPNDEFNMGGHTIETWPSTATYPDYFFTGMPHINYYSGSMTYTNLKLSVPAE